MLRNLCQPQRILSFLNYRRRNNISMPINFSLLLTLILMVLSRQNLKIQKPLSFDTLELMCQLLIPLQLTLHLRRLRHNHHILLRNLMVLIPHQLLARNTPPINLDLIELFSFLSCLCHLIPFHCDCLAGFKVFLVEDVGVEDESVVCSSSEEVLEGDAHEEDVDAAEGAVEGDLLFDLVLFYGGVFGGDVVEAGSSDELVV